MASAVWALAAGGYGLWSWADEHAELRRAFDDGARGCRQRYADRGRQERCVALFRTVYEGDRNAAVFTIVVVSILPPVVAFGFLGLWRVMSRPAAAVPSRSGRSE